MDRPRIARELIRMGMRSASIYPASDWSLTPRAIMEIRAQLSSLDPRPQGGPWAGPDFSCAGETVFPSSSFSLADLGGKAPDFCVAARLLCHLGRGEGGIISTSMIEHRPGDASELVGQCRSKDVFM